MLLSDGASPLAAGETSFEPAIRIGTNYSRQRYLYAFATQAEVTHFVRTQAIPDEAAQLPEILEKWHGLRGQVQTVVVREAGVANSMSVRELPSEFEDRLIQCANDPLFQKSFSALPTTFGLVEIDKLVAAQRTVNLDYVDRLTARFSGVPTTADLIDLCVSPKREMDPIQHLEIGPNVHVFSSPNSDIRFLGSFLKQLDTEDLGAAVSGGLPAAAVISFVGYGAASVNVIAGGNRVVLNNGFHRVYALRSLGVTHVPAVVQSSQNPALDFPPHVAGLPKEYLLGAPRPVLMKDFFQPEFAITLKIRSRLKVVTVGVNLGQHDVPA
jgi:hypothetical protein